MRIEIVALGLLLLIPLLSACDHRRSVDEPPSHPPLPWPTAGWPVAPPSRHGLDSTRIAGLIDPIVRGYYGRINSLLIVKDGLLVVDRYFNGMAPDSLQCSYSITKSVASALVGIALDRHELADTHQRLAELLPQYSDLIERDSLKRAITLENLLTMTAGFRWNERSYADRSNDFYRMFRSRDRVEYVLERPIVSTPGGGFLYSSGDAILLAGVLADATGLSAHDYAIRYLFNPLGIRTYRWGDSAGRLTNTANALYLTPHDLAKFGYLYLRNGEWEGKQVVSKAWVERSTDAHIGVNRLLGFGYLWWRISLADTLRRKLPGGIYYATGTGDQFIFVLPDLRMVVVATGNNRDDTATYQPYRFLFDYILPSDSSLSRR